MSNNYGVNKYRQTSVTTASRGQVLLMLYEGAMKYCRLAIEAIKAKNLAEKGKYILKVQDILNELSCTLDHNVGGEISKELERLYNFMVEKITEANIKNDPKPMEETLKLLDTLYQGWVVAIRQVNANGGDPISMAATEKTGQTVNPAAAAAKTNVPKPGGK